MDKEFFQRKKDAATGISTIILSLVVVLWWATSHMFLRMIAPQSPFGSLFSLSFYPQIIADTVFLTMVVALMELTIVAIGFAIHWKTIWYGLHSEYKIGEKISG